jgi:AbrB family looped-hinge helix DNA binding protein
LQKFRNTDFALSEKALIKYILPMKITLTVTESGTVTLPAKLRKAMGIEADSLLIAESAEDGILLRPAVALPVEVYSRDRLDEFAAAEQDLADWYAKCAEFKFRSQ